MKSRSDREPSGGLRRSPTSMRACSPRSSTPRASWLSWSIEATRRTRSSWLPATPSSWRARSLRRCGGSVSGRGADREARQLGAMDGARVSGMVVGRDHYLSGGSTYEEYEEDHDHDERLPPHGARLAGRTGAIG